MFKQRLLTALVLIPIVLICLYFANDLVLVGVLVALMLALGWEWTGLIPLKARLAKIIFLVVLIGLMIGMMKLVSLWVIWDSLLWLGILVALLTYPTSQSIWGHPWLVMGVAWFLLALFANSLWALMHMPDGRYWLVYLLCLVWATDIGAYAAGKLWGSHRLIPNVSPGKTVEGMLGGMACALVVAGLGMVFAHPAHVMVWFGKALIVIVGAMIGDLFISMLKRRCQLKDTGQLLPGHGGILDRLDSLIAVLPFFYYFCQSWR